MTILIRTFGLIALFSIINLPAAFADELTQIIQQDLVALGYDTGGVDGEMTTATIIAISKFQSENDLEVTGAASPQLAGIIKATASPQLKVAAAPDPALLQAAQQTCLQEKITVAQQSQKKKRGFNSLLKAAARTAGKFGGIDMNNQIAKASVDIYDANATAADLKQAAKDLGLTEDDVEACRNPAM